jgi:hypothetical protein
MRAWRDPAIDLVRPLLRGLAKDPSDGLPDEELRLVEHRVRAARERLERGTGLQRFQLCEERRPPDPEVLVSCPTIERASDAEAKRHLSDHVAGQDVHQRPRARFADQSLEKTKIVRPECASMQLEDERRGQAALEHRLAPELLDQVEGPLPIEFWVPRGLPDCPPDIGEASAEETKIALQVSLLSRGSRGRPRAPELRLERSRELRGVRHAGSIGTHAQ